MSGSSLVADWFDLLSDACGGEIGLACHASSSALSCACAGALHCVARHAITCIGWVLVIGTA